MKIAVPTQENYQIESYSENCPFYTIFSISDENEIMAETILETIKDSGCETNLAGELADMNVNIMLTGQNNDLLTKELISSKIHVICNCKGNVYEIVEQYLEVNY
jgi:predicted Fe-Mo cluster-binding NifX family protein